MYLGLGVLLLGFWRQANWLSLVCVTLPGIVVFLSIGTLASAFIVLFKQGDPILSSYTWVTAVFGGVFFPISSLPSWLQPVSLFVPLTYALTGLRAALQGASPTEVAPQAFAVLLAGAVLWPISLFCFNWAVRRAKMEGSLVQY
jgi:ABC-2 type transport system permease protein